MISGNVIKIQIVFPGSSEEHIRDLVGMASSFFYIISAQGKTGVCIKLAENLSASIACVRFHTDLPLVIGFGIKNPKMERVFHIYYATGLSLQAS